MYNVILKKKLSVTKNQYVNRHYFDWSVFNYEQKVIFSSTYHKYFLIRMKNSLLQNVSYDGFPEKVRYIMISSHYNYTILFIRVVTRR